MRTIISSPLLSILALAATTNAAIQRNAQPAVTLLYEFPKGTWIENIAVRSNGALLLTHLNVPEVWSLDPSTANPVPTLLHRFATGNRVSGITELAPDKFAVNVLQSTGFTEPATCWIWTLDLAAQVAASAVTKSAVAGAKFLNGLTSVSPATLLAADSQVGLVYGVDVATGAARVVLNESTTDGMGIGGVNGVHVAGNYLYFTNTMKGLFARVPVDRATGSTAGPVEVLVEELLGADDFAIGPKQVDAYVVNALTGVIYRIDFATKKSEVFVKDPRIAGPTSATFGRGKLDQNTLYVVTNGNLLENANSPNGGRVFAIKL
jgi:hypothetical protein